MKIPKRVSKFCAIFMSVFLTNLPAQVFAQGKMIPTNVVVADLSRSQAEARIQGFLNNSELKEALAKQGLNPDEINARIANLSDTEVKQLAGQMEQARYGGEILVTILVILLIIFLIKRI
jgi:hypothetical protein